MVYFAPYIDAEGLHTPLYTDIRDSLIEEFKRIYGSDIYLENDSQDYQMISAFALMQFDTIQLLQIIYSNRSPKTAVGTALDSIIKLNGIKRNSASYSTCVLTLTGAIGTTITNGIVEDISNNRWFLPQTVTFNTETIEVSAQAENLGAIEALAGTITKIVTPTRGWYSVNNEVSAVTGAPIETDALLKDKQSISVALPSQTIKDGISAGIANISGVKRYKVYENDTSITDGNGIPSHSISAVVEGGLDNDIAEQIYLRKGLGCGTYGDTTITYTDIDGLPNIINFFRPDYVPIDVTVTILRRTNYYTDMKQQIQQKIEDYINNLEIGVSVTLTGLYTSILSLVTDMFNPVFSPTSITIASSGESLTTSDIDLAFKEIAEIGTITINEV